MVLSRLNLEKWTYGVAKIGQGDKDMVLSRLNLDKRLLVLPKVE